MPMNAPEFLLSAGLIQAEEILKNAPEGMLYWISRDEYHISPISFPNMTDHFAVELSKLREVVESLNIVRKMGSIESVVKHIDSLEHSTGEFCLPTETYDDIKFRLQRLQLVVDHWKVVYLTGIQYLKDFGLNHAEEICKEPTGNSHGVAIPFHPEILLDLIQDHKLIQQCGGIDQSKELLKSVHGFQTEYIGRYGTQYKISSNNPDQLALMSFDIGQWMDSRHTNKFVVENFLSVKALKNAVSNFKVFLGELDV
jgi:hypothetical protein